MNVRYALLDIDRREFVDGDPAHADGDLYSSFRDAEEARKRFPSRRRLAIVRTKVLNPTASVEPTGQP